jgi:LuxR family maltose regulon positive regulatory protein
MAWVGGEAALRPSVDSWGVLTAKLRPPALRSDVLVRFDLADRLALSRSPLVTVLAGAGYGKTTLARQWLASERRPYAWVTLDRGDDDPVVFLRHVVRALHRVEPLPAVEAVLAGPSVQVQRVVLPALSVAMDGGRTPFVLVLDDAHRLTSADSLQVLEHLIDLVPDDSRLVVIGRAVPSLRFTRRLLTDRAETVRQDDLRFRPAEARTLLGTALPSIDDTTATALFERTEGWPAGLHLAVLALRDSSDLPGTVHELQELASADEHLEDYFHHELLAHLEPAERSFLVRTSVLERFTAGLCDAVLERTDSASMIGRLASSGNQFLVRLDGQPPSFRYHQLFADLMLAELRRTAPHDEPGLRRRAARYLVAKGRSEAAVAQAQASGDVEFAAGIVFAEVYRTISRGHIASLERWLAGFATEDLHRLPLLAIARGWLEFSLPDQPYLRYWIEVAERLVRAETEVEAVLRKQDRTAVDPALALAALNMTSGAGGLREAAKNARVVRTAEPVASPYWALSWLMEAQALLAAGELPDPVLAFSQAEQATRGMALVHSISLAHLAWSTSLAHDRERAWTLMQAAVDELEAAGLSEVTLGANVWAIFSLLSAERGLDDRSAEAAARAERLLEGAREANRGVTQGRLFLADAAVIRGDLLAAERLLHVVRGLLQREPDAAGHHDWANRVAARLAARSERWVPRLTDAERRVLAELPSHHSLAEIGEHLYISRHTVKTHAVAIYRKLGVASRSAAVRRARELGLLDD